MKPTITLSDRSSFDLSQPETQRYDIVVIAHALSKLCRFTGHIEGNAIYSVAQHSVLVSRMVPPEHALDGLLHDAHEAYCGDMSAPLKLLCPDYCAVERRIEVACRRSFGLADTKHELVSVADKMLFEREHEAYIKGKPSFEFYVQSSTIGVALWSPFEAKRRFLERYEELTTARDLWQTPPVL